MNLPCDKASQTLASWISSRRFPHAVLLEGQEDADKTAFATEIARAVMCKNEADGAIPCGVCAHCVKIEKGIHPDLSFYSGEGRARSFHIDKVRELRSAAWVRPNEADIRIFVLADVQDMSAQAQNALLKILEEPPRSVAFVLTCVNKAALLDTVLSRVTVLSLEANGESETLSTEEAESGNQDGQAILDALLSGNELEALAIFSKYERDRQAFLAVLSSMRSVVETLLLKPSDKPEHSSLRLSGIIDIIDEAVTRVAGNAGLQLLACCICARIMEK